MKPIIPYIAFPGTCREALEFYAEVLGGEITVMQAFNEAPMEVPDALAMRIFNAEMTAGELTIKASDDLPTHPVSSGNNMSLYLHFDSESRKKSAFDALAEGGQVLFPITDNFGMLKDKYNIQWMFVHR